MGALKYMPMKAFAERFGCKVFFETGTGKGGSLKHAMQDGPFEKLFSVEMNETLFEEQSKRRWQPRVMLIKGESVLALEHLLGEPGPVMFWLDAHFPGADYGLGTYEAIWPERVRAPLFYELEWISKHRNCGDVIFVDDWMLYEQSVVIPEKYRSTEKLTIAQVEALFPEHNVEKVVQGVNKFLGCDDVGLIIWPKKETKKTMEATETDAYEDIQRKFCSNSRQAPNLIVPDRMGKRLERNIAEVAKYFDKSVPILDIGCGDGLSLQIWAAHGFNAKGLEIVKERVATAAMHGLDVTQGSAEDLIGGKVSGLNVFASHCLEHTRDQPKVMKVLQDIAEQTICILVPIEFKMKSGNIAHFSPVKNLEQVKAMVDKTRWRVQYEEYRSHLEPEGLLILRRI